MRDCTRCSNDSRDLAGDDGAEVPRDPPRRFSDRSPPAAAELEGAGGGPPDPDPLPTLLMLPPVAGPDKTKILLLKLKRIL